MEPESCTVGEAAHTICSAPAITVAATLIVMRTASLAGGHGRFDDELVSVSVTLPATISDGDGVYVGFRTLRLGLNVPVPPVHEPVVTVPVTDPLSWTCGLVAQTTWSTPALTTVIGSIVIVTWSLTGGHGPVGSFVVSVSVTVPAAISPAEGVYFALRLPGFGWNVPAPPLHVPPEALPPTEPASCTSGL